MLEIFRNGQTNLNFPFKEQKPLKHCQGGPGNQTSGFQGIHDGPFSELRGNEITSDPVLTTPREHFFTVWKDFGATGNPGDILAFPSLLALYL